MADNITLNSGSGGSTLATDDIGGTHYQIVKLGWGALDSVNVADVANPVPIQISDGTDTALVTAAGLLQVDASGATVTVSGTVTADAGTGFPSVATDAGAHGASQTGTRAMGSDGTNDQQISVNASGHINIADGGNIITVDGTVTADAGTGTRDVGGVAAHDAAASGNPVAIGAVAETPDDSAPANQVSADADAVRLAADRDGAMFTHPHPPRIWHVSTEHTAAETDTTVKAAPGVGLSLYVTDIYIAVNAAVDVTLEEGTATLKFKYYGSGQGDGVAKHFISPLKLTANTALTVTTSGAVSVTLVVSGYTAP